ncbi:MAG TPA: hypothetical protein VF212_06910 [Longimicrobiales bacterium]
MKYRIVASCLALLVVPAVGSAQSVGARADASASAEVQAPSPQSRIEAALEAAAAANVPTVLLERKVAEGRAKRVPEDRIAAAVESRLRALVRAREVLDRAELESVAAGDLSIAADALEAGISETALIAVSRDAPRERRAVATAVLTDLVRIGHSSQQALARVSGALSAGPSALANLRAQTVAALRLRGKAGTGLGILP